MKPPQVPSTRPSVAIVVLNWNNPVATSRCLDSVNGLAVRPSEVIVVDNGSTDDSVEFICHHYAWARLLRLEANLGYAGGNNEGIRFALDRGADFVLLLNNDVTVEPDTLSRLLTVAIENPRNGIIGPKVLCTTEEPTLFAAGSQVNWGKGDLQHRGMFAPDSPQGQTGRNEPVDFLVGCCLMASRPFLEQVGLFDPEYFLNYEDVDWGIRANRAGFRVVYVPDAVIWHEVSGTLGRSSPANTYYMTRNALRFFWLRSPRTLKWIAVARILGRTLRTILAWTVRDQYRNEFHRRKRKANLLAIRDFLLGRFGEMGPGARNACFSEGGKAN